MSDPERWPRAATPTQPGSKERANNEPDRDADIDPFGVLSRTRLLIILFIAVILVVIFRLVAWQMLPAETDAPVALAEDNSRGRIVDRNGLLLASDNFLWEVYIRKNRLETLTRRPTLLAELAIVLDVSDGELRRRLLETDANLVILQKNVSTDQCKAIEGLKELEVVWCAPRRYRAYPQGTLAAHIIGFANMDQQGVTGIEGSYDAWLRAAGRAPFQQLPGHEEPLPEGWRVYLPSPGGRDLVLHLNAPLQQAVEERLKEAVASSSAEGGTIIVLDPNTDGILALANWPTYDLNQYGSADQARLRSAASEYSYEPGSVFKLITYAAALDSGQITPDTLFNDTGKLEVDGRLIQNAEKRRYGKLTATQALERSVNTISARMSLDIGPEAFYRYVSRFGFGKPTEADVVYEDRGVVKRYGTDAYSRFDQATNSFGQAITVTPLQMANAVAAIANGGVLLQPQVVAAVVVDGKLHRLERRVMGQAIKPETARTLARMMVNTAESYSVKNLAPGYRVAAKTGTAEIATERGYTSDLTITSCVGFLPAADPQVVVLVKLDKPRSSKWAEKVALPVFQQVAQDAIAIMKIQPDDRLP